MSATVIASSSTEELIAGFRAKRLTRNQVVAALVAAGATATGAALLVQAVENSPGTPNPVTPATVHHPASTGLTGISHTNMVALHQRHVQMQGGR
jgi:hypothetical protein